MSAEATPSYAPQPKKSNLGCILISIVGGFVVVGLICAGVIGAGVFGLFAMIKSSEPYTESLRRVQQSVEIQQALGEPIEAGSMVQGNINLNNDDGNADLTYSVSGPEGTASVHVVGEKSGGRWEYQKLEATIKDSGDVVDLRE